MKAFLHDFLISLTLTLLFGGATLVFILSLLAKPPLDARKSDRLSVIELEGGKP